MNLFIYLFINLFIILNFQFQTFDRHVCVQPLSPDLKQYWTNIHLDLFNIVLTAGQPKRPVRITR